MKQCQPAAQRKWLMRVGMINPNGNYQDVSRPARKPRMNLQELRLRVDYRCAACAALSIHPFIGFENRYAYVDH